MFTVHYFNEVFVLGKEALSALCCSGMRPNIRREDDTQVPLATVTLPMNRPFLRALNQRR